MNMCKVLTTLIGLLCLSLTCAWATVPNLINFQGTLTDTSGNPINSTISLMRFTLYADSAGTGLALWSENQSNVQITDGLFRVILGSSTAFPSSLFNGSKRWLSIRIVPDLQDLTPRQPLVMVPYGYRAKEADHSVRADTATYAVRADSANWSPNSLQIPLHLTGDTASAAIIWGTNTTDTGYGIKGDNSSSGNYGMLGGSYYGAFGRNLNANRGYLGHDDYGVWGMHSASGNWGNIGDATHAVYGEHNSGTIGFLGGDWGGVYGSSPTGQYWGYLGFVSAGTYGYSSAGPWGLLGNDSIGVWGSSSVSSGGGVYGRYLSGPSGWLGRSSYGVYGIHTNGNYGYLGGSAAGAYGNSGSSNGFGGFFYASGSNGYGIYANSTGSGGIGLYARGGTGGRAATLRGNVVIQGLTSGTTVLELGEGLDYAEGFDVESQNIIEPGTVLVIDSDNSGKLTISTEPYDSRVAGIVAGAKGLGSGVRLGAEQFDHNVALAGRVYCNVIADESNIKPGDLLTTSSTPGYAMKASDYSRAPGTILGKAMEHLEKGQKGQILVLVTLQ